MLYTVGEMAKRLQVAPSTLRYYDKEGLLPFLERSNGGIRMFRESDFEWLSIIACLKQTGMPIKDIKTFIDWCVEGDATIGQRLGLIDRQRQRVLEQIRQLRKHCRSWTTSTGTTRRRRKPAAAPSTIA